MRWILILLVVAGACRTVKKQEISRADSSGISSAELHQQWASETLREYRIPAMQLPSLVRKDTVIVHTPEPVIIREYIRQKANTSSSQTHAATVKSEETTKETSSSNTALYLMAAMGLELIIILALLLLLIFRLRR